MYERAPTAVLTPYTYVAHISSTCTHPHAQQQSLLSRGVSNQATPLRADRTVYVYLRHVFWHTRGRAERARAIIAFLSSFLQRHVANNKKKQKTQKQGRNHRRSGARCAKPASKFYHQNMGKGFLHRGTVGIMGVGCLTSTGLATTLRASTVSSFCWVRISLRAPAARSSPRGFRPYLARAASTVSMI